MRQAKRAALLAASAFAALATPAHAGWFTAKIDRIHTFPNGGFTLYLNSAVNHECGSLRIDFFDPSAAGAKMIYAALLAYEAQKSHVQFLITGCSGVSGIFANIEGEPGL